MNLVMQSRDLSKIKRNPFFHHTGVFLTSNNTFSSFTEINISLRREDDDDELKQVY